MLPTSCTEALCRPQCQLESHSLDPVLFTQLLTVQSCVLQLGQAWVGDLSASSCPSPHQHQVCPMPSIQPCHATLMDKLRVSQK